MTRQDLMWVAMRLVGLLLAGYGLMVLPQAIDYFFRYTLPSLTGHAPDVPELRPYYGHGFVALAQTLLPMGAGLYLIGGGKALMRWMCRG